MNGQSYFESRTELEPGLRLPAPFDRMVIAELVKRTDSGRWLYRVEIRDEPDPVPEGDAGDAAGA